MPEFEINNQKAFETLKSFHRLKLLNHYGAGMFVDLRYGGLNQQPVEKIFIDALNPNILSEEDPTKHVFKGVQKNLKDFDQLGARKYSVALSATSSVLNCAETITQFENDPRIKFAIDFMYQINQTFSYGEDFPLVFDSFVKAVDSNSAEEKLEAFQKSWLSPENTCHEKFKNDILKGYKATLAM